MEKIHDVLLTMGVRTNGSWEKEYDMLKKKVPISKKEVDEAYGRLACEGLAFTDPLYPENLKNIWHPPLALFYYGNIGLLKAPRIVSVVGSREATPYGLAMAERLVGGALAIDRDLVIASGMALGIDAQAQRTAMAQGAGVISVLGSGIERPYPDSSRDIYEYCKSGKGLVLSEYPFEVEPDREHFPFRNRIIAGICQVLLVVECQRKSGTSVTVRHAVEFGKTVLTVPHDVTPDDLTGDLIREGSGVCIEPLDLAKAFN